MGAGASRKVNLEGKTTEEARVEAQEQVNQMLTGYDSDVDNELGYKYAGRREISAVADGSGQGMNIKPWAGAVVAPTKWADKTQVPQEYDLPESLALEFAYGYRGYDSRDNLYYTSSGEIVYVTAGLGVVYDPGDHKQRFYFDHTDDILCLALHPTGSLVATGQIGAKPTICLWDTNSMNTVARIHGTHERGISSVAISSDGKRIVSIGMDDNNTIVVNEINGEKITVAGTTKGGTNKLYLAKFNPVNINEFVVIGQKVMRIVTIEPTGLGSKNGLFGQKGPQNVLSLCFLSKGQAVTGTENGEIYKWKGQNIEAAVQAHQGPVFSLFGDGDVIVSGGKDGRVLLLNVKLEITKSFDLRDIAANLTDSLGRPMLHTPAKAPVVKSVCRERGKILVGTNSCEVVEIDEATSTGKLFVQGLSSGEVWGLATHPSEDQFVTACDDKTVRVWDAHAKHMIGMRKLASEARSASYSHDGSLIAIGMLDGSFMVVKSLSLKEVTIQKLRKEEISDLKFSPDGRMLAVGSHDNFIDIYDVTRDYKLIGTCRGHSSFIIHLDWSSDSKYIQSNCGAYELLFWDARTQDQITKPTELRDVQWATWTCILGWPVQGIWAKNAKGTDVNAVDRSHLGDLLVTADDFAMVNLFDYPVPTVGMKCKRYPGHSAHVTNVKFTFDDKRIITTGGNDKTILQWRKLASDKATIDDKEDAAVEAELDLSNYENNRSYKEKTKPIEVVPVYEENAMQRSTRPPKEKEAAPAPTPAEPAASSKKASSSIPEGWFRGPQPWTGAIFAPTNPPPVSAEAPQQSLALDFVCGYRGQDARDNIYYTSDGNVVYSSAGVAVVHNPTTNEQKFYAEHNDDIISLALHPDRNIVATGQVGRDPAILVWDSRTLQRLAVLKGIHQRGVSSLGFSPDGSKLASIGLDDKHTLVVWDWKAQKIIANADGHTDKIFSVDFNPYDETTIVTAGVKHIKFWKLEGKLLEARKGIFGTVGELQNIHSTAFLSPSVVLAGAQNGDIYKFEKNVLKEVIKGVHRGAVMALDCGKEGVISGGSDGKIKLFTTDMQPFKDIVLDFTEFSKNNTAYGHSLRSVRWVGNKVVVGTESSEIYDVDVSTKSIKKIANGHSAGETWGLAAHPSLPKFATASEDCTVRIWNVTDKKMEVMKKLGSPCTSVAFAPNGGHIAVGTLDGQFIILDAQELGEKVTRRERTERIGDLKYSPDGKWLAVASNDNFIDVYNVANGYKRESTCKGHSSFITHIDWSADSQYLQSNCGAYEVLFWHASTGQQEKFPNKLRDVAWHTQTCVLGWSVQGIWPKGADGTDVNMAAASNNKQLIVTGDDFGQVRLYRFPSAIPRPGNKTYIGHSAHVTNVQFTFDDNYVISTGGGDRTVMIWKVK